MTTRVAVVGATGRIGTLVCRLIEESHDFELSARVGSGEPLSDVIGADVVVDVTAAAVSQSIVEFCIQHGISVVVGTSGWSSERIDQIRAAVAAVPELAVIIVPNFSIGSILATAFSAVAAKFFDSIEIIEAHHVAKTDSPSGTAIRTAELMGTVRDGLGPVIAPHADQRARGQQVASIPIHSLRMQGVVAKQEVLLGGPGELLTIAHETLDSRAYEAGIMAALRAARTATGVIVGLDKLITLGIDPIGPQE
jgi:4-hydroxy-tetrahydrodipicolinate reductase